MTSQSYGLVREYGSPRGPVIHIDLYRLEEPEELLPLGWDDILRCRGLVLVEWPERAGDALPPHRIALALEHVPGRPEVRRLRW